MGGVEDKEPPKKRLKVSSLEPKSCLTNPVPSKSIYPIGGPMVRPQPSQPKDDMIGPSKSIRKEEFVKIIAQALYSLGYNRSGQGLEEESGIHLYSSTAKLFRKQLLNGNFDESVITLQELRNILDEDTLTAASFLIYEHKFLDLLEKDRVLDALKTLRTEITSLNINKRRVHELSGCIISSSQHSLLGFGDHGIETGKSREKLLRELEKLLPEVMIPERRLEELVEQAVDVQSEECYFHNTSDMVSLYTDHECGNWKIPSQTVQILQEHKDEVWFLQFSNNGKYLASSSSDKSAIVWEVNEDGELLLKHTLKGHEKPVLMVAWSPDDRQLLTCGLEEVAKLWDVSSGECLHSYKKDGLGLIFCGWFPSGSHIFLGATNKSICVLELNGKEVECWKGQQRSKTSDMAVTKDGKKIISMGTETRILLFDKELRFENVIEEDQVITSFSLSSDDAFLLVNLVNQEIHLWSILDSPELLLCVNGHKRNRFVIRSCFGGSEETFIASGSEDSQVYIWHRVTGEIVHILPGHSAAVNCVSWNPMNPYMLASASDDHTIRIWGVNSNNLKRKSSSSNGVLQQCNAKSKGT